MPALSKHLTDEEKSFAHRRLCEMVVMGVMTQNLQVMTDTSLFTAAVDGDSARAGALLAATSSAGGLIEFVCNPVIGRMTDDYGRKWVYYIGPLVSGIGMSIAVLLTQGKSLPVLLLHKAACWSLISMSLSFIGPVTISDMYSGQELGIRTVKMFGSIGLGVIVAPALGALIMQRTGERGPMNVFKLRLVFAALQLLYVHRFIPETLLAERRRPFSISDVNPFSFVRLFQKSHTLRVLAAALFFNCCVEGKNIVPLLQTWMNGYPLRWPLSTQSRATVLYGAMAYMSGMHLAPKLIRLLGPRRFTSITNTLNTAAFACMGSTFPSFDVAHWVGLLIHGPGVNNTSAAALKGAATEHAIANGIARGEYGGMYSSMRTLSMILAPPLFGWAYKTGVPRSMGGRGIPWLPWLIMAFVGGALPEVLHRSLTDDDLKVPQASQ